MRFRLCTFGLFFLCLSAQAIETPDYLSGQAARAFDDWRGQEQHRAFALSRTGAWGQSWRHESQDAARSAALEYCREHADECVIIAVDDRLTAAVNPFPDRTVADEDKTSWPNGVSVVTARWLALAGFWLLLIGTVAAWRWPLMFRSHRGVIFQRQTIRINYTWVLVITGYVLCEMPQLARWLPTRDGPWWHWVAWIVIIGAIPAAALILHRGGKLAKAH